MKKTLIQNGNIVLEDRVIQGDLLIENGKIAQISDSPIDTDGCEVIQAAGKMILPGMIDTHAHLSDPGPYNEICCIRRHYDDCGYAAAEHFGTRQGTL